MLWGGADAIPAYDDSAAADHAVNHADTTNDDSADAHGRDDADVDGELIITMMMMMVVVVVVLIIAIMSMVMMMMIMMMAKRDERETKGDMR